MPIWWKTCTICGQDFVSVDPARTTCSDKKRHAKIATEKRTRKDPKERK